MLQKLTKKMTLLFALSCVLSLGIGVVLGYGIHTQNLTGTAVLPDDLNAVLMGMQLNHATQLDQQLKEQIALIQERNQEISEKNDELAQARLKENEARSQGNKAAEAAAKQLVEKLKAEIDALSLAQQRDMVRLQELVSKRDQTFEMMTNFIGKMQDARSSILGEQR